MNTKEAFSAINDRFQPISPRSFLNRLTNLAQKHSSGRSLVVFWINLRDKEVPLSPFQGEPVPPLPPR